MQETYITKGIRCIPQRTYQIVNHYYSQERIVNGNSQLHIKTNEYGSCSKSLTNKLFRAYDLSLGTGQVSTSLNLKQLT